MKPVVADAGVLLRFCDPDDPLHAAARTALTDHLTAGRPLVVPVNVLSEMLVNAYRTTPHAVLTVEKFVAKLASEIHPVDLDCARAAARYRAEHPGLPLGVALTFGTAKAIQATHVLTTDPAWLHLDVRTVVVR
jgi:PIN domain nuclease of toxin-antitoxin system